TGHHGLEISGDDNLFTRFRFGTRFIHDITVEHAAGNVISAGSGIDLALDHHKYASHANLFTDLDAGAGARLWMCGGGANLGKHSGAWETFWNIRAARPQSWPPKDFAPDLINLVGLQTNQQSQTTPAGKWFETIPPADLTPQDLHKAQLKRRLAPR
ncbi:MAG: Pectate lyase superfamily protein, partial [Phycisphaerales bacterium]|nr:Pectate lyase superfamily protein [Phycisphaerales bacterium]